MEQEDDDGLDDDEDDNDDGDSGKSLNPGGPILAKLTNWITPIVPIVRKNWLLQNHENHNS